MPVRSKMKCAMSMLAGMGCGAVAMYLADPNSGARRREQAKHQSATALAAAGAVTAATLEHARDAAAQFSQETSGKYHYLRDKEMHAQLRHLAFPSRSRPSDHTTSVGTIALAAVSAAAIGAGLMFLLDPGSGPIRRSLIKNRAQRAAHKAGGYLQNATGKVTSRLTPDPDDRATPTQSPEADEALAARIRAEIALTHPNPQDVYVSCSGGQVTLEGSLPEHQQEQLVRRLRDMEGITAIVNNLSSATAPMH